MPFLNNLTYLAVKLESVPGTAETLAAADFNIRARGIEITPNIEFDDEQSKFATGDHGEDQAIAGAQSVTIAFSEKLSWAGSVTAEPVWWKMAKACGLKEKTYTTTGIALQPSKDYDAKTVTIGGYIIEQGAAPQAVHFKAAGCIGTATIGCEGIGKPWVMNYTFTGKLVDVVDVTNVNLLALTSPDTALPEVLLSNTMTIGGVTQRISSFQLNLGNQINPLINQAEATGYDYYSITARQPRFSCNPLIQRVATEDFHSFVISETSKVITLTSLHFTLKIPVAQALNPAIANREGYVNWGQNWKCLRNAAADALIASESTFELLIGARA